MSHYLGIDQSYTGFAMVFLNSETGDHTDYLTKFDTKKHGTGIDRLLAIHEHVRETLAAQSLPSHVCMEGYASGAKFGRESAGELGATVKMALRNSGIYPTIVPPTSLKKFVTGKGNAKKQEMLLGVYKRWGVEYADDNLADAYALARLAATSVQPGDIPAFQKDVINRLTLNTEKRK